MNTGFIDLGAIGARIIHMGPVGAGQAFGLDMDKVIEVVGSGAAANWFLTHRGPTMVRNDFKVGFKLALHHKDLSICKTMAESFKASLISIDQTLPLYEQLMAEGHGDEDISVLFRLKQRLFEQKDSSKEP